MIDTMLKNDHLYTVPVLVSLNKFWRQFATLRVLCGKFPYSEMLLNILVTGQMVEIPESLDMITEADLELWQKRSHSLDVVVLLALWDMPFDANAIDYAVEQYLGTDYTLKENKWKLQQQLDQIYQSDHDPFVKNILLHIVMMITYPHDDIHLVCRIVEIVSLKHMGWMDFPLLYHQQIIGSFEQLNSLPETPAIESAITGNHIEYLANQFHFVCSLGIAILTIYHRRIEEMFELIKSDATIHKIFRHEDVLVTLCQNIVVTITYIMDKFDWKRDKAARFLARLSEMGILIELKRGKEKYFLNNITLQTFKELRTNQQIQSMIK